MRSYKQDIDTRMQDTADLMTSKLNSNLSEMVSQDTMETKIKYVKEGRFNS